MSPEEADAYQFCYQQGFAEGWSQSSLVSSGEWPALAEAVSSPLFVVRLRAALAQEPTHEEYPTS